MAQLLEGELELLGMLPGASNYTLLAKLSRPQEDSPAVAAPDAGPSGVGEVEEQLVVYKPRRGETPLWDFPPGTLCQREVAACVVAQASGWDFVPPTVLRDGPLGPGAVQLYIQHDPSITAFDLIRSHRAELKRIALYDLVVNNADRKAGHVLLDAAGKVWGVDHGLCFHQEPKLRTVLWDFVGERMAPDDLEAVLGLCDYLESDRAEELAELLTPSEIQTMRKRVRRVLDDKVYPAPETLRPYPWPPV